MSLSHSTLIYCWLLSLYILFEFFFSFLPSTFAIFSFLVTVVSMTQKLWNRRGQHVHYYLSEGSRNRVALPYLYNPITFKWHRDPLYNKVIPLVEEARLNAHRRVSDAVEDATRTFLTRLGLPFSVTRCGMILLEDGDLARRMTAWLDRCVGGMDAELQRSLKGGLGIQKRAGRRTGANKSNRFSLQKNKTGDDFDITRPSKMLHIALARASKRALRIALECVVRRFVEALDDSSYVQAYIDAYFVRAFVSLCVCVCLYL